MAVGGEKSFARFSHTGIVFFIVAPTGADHEPLAGLPSGVPPLERARQRVGQKVD